MQGRTIDISLLTAWLATFLIVAMTHPGLANLLIAWLGAVLLGWYNTLIRHNPADDSLRPPWRRPLSDGAPGRGLTLRRGHGAAPAP